MAASSPRREYDMNIKYYLVGESEVGKTTLMRRFAIDKYIPDFQRTKAFDYRGKALFLQGKSLFVEFWDTIGLEKYRKRAAPPPLTRAHAIFIIYDITNLRSFDSAEQWIQDIKAVVPRDMRILLIGNKLDLEVERVVPFERGYELATRYNLVFYETSAKTGRSVEDIVMNTTNHILNDHFAKKIIEKELIALNKSMKEGGKCNLL